MSRCKVHTAADSSGLHSCSKQGYEAIAHKRAPAQVSHEAGCCMDKGKLELA